MVVLSQSAQAGWPIENETECPVGGEKFKTTTTASCSYFGGRPFMSFKPISSCDFVTRLPVCPKNQLPVYRDFSDEDVDRLRKYIRGKEYKAQLDQSRYYRAYRIEEFLNSADDSHSQFYLLLNGLWYSYVENTNRDYFDAFFAESEDRLTDDSRDGWAYEMAIVAYFRYWVGDAPRAIQMLDRVKATSNYEEEGLARYVDAIEQCIAVRSPTECGPDVRYYDPYAEDDDDSDN